MRAVKIGRFEVVEEVGRGGMGLVYKAWDPTLDRTVAIKQLTLVTEEHLERFRQEARAAGRLLHPNITTVYEFGDQAGEPYIVMEYLDGSSLRSHIRGHSLPRIEDKAEVLRQVCVGLDFAHNQGVAAHRDIKPANIQVTTTGLVKIMDFGIAKLADEIHMTRNLTQANTVLGTLYYMSPEQIRGEKVDRRSDVWSVGAVLYELVYGLKPFDDPEDDGVMKKIVLEELTHFPGLDVHYEDELRRIILRALDKERERRYATAGEMASDLQGYLRMVAGSAPFPVKRLEKSAEAWFAEGREHYAAGRFVRAIECFQEVLDLRPGNPSAEVNLRVSERAQRRKHAEELYRTGILLFKNREFGVAAAVFEELLALEPANEDARTLVNWARRELKKGAERTDFGQLVEGTLQGILEDEPGPLLPSPSSRPAEASGPIPATLPGLSLNASAAPRPAAGSREDRPSAEELALEARERSTSRVPGWIRKIFSRER